MANEFKVKNGLIVIGDLTTSGTITINGALAATQSWVISQAYLTSASLSGYATQSYVTSAITALVDAAPTTLDTLNELAAALGDDANFSTTVTNSIATKLPLAGGTLIGDLTLNYTYPRINLYDSNNDSDYSLINSDGAFSIYDVTNNAHRIWVTGAGNVGIGTTSPTNTLFVGIPNSTTGKGISLGSTAGTEFARFGVINPSVDNNTFIGSVSNNSFSIYSNNAERIRINTSGNVGIGLTAPSARLHLGGSGNTEAVIDASINGSAILSILNSVGGSGVIGYSSGALRFGTVTGANAAGFSEKMRIEANGNVGIGTTNPGYKLSIAGSGNTYNISPHGSGVDVYSTGNIAPHYQTNYWWFTGVPGAGTFRMGLDASGNLGIGTSSPAYKLDVVGSGRVSDTLFVNTTINRGKLNITGYDNGGINIIDQRTSSSGVFNSSITFRDYYDSVVAASIDFYHNQFFGSGVNRLGFSFEGSERLTILRSGNVGIGTSSPTSRLSVNVPNGWNSTNYAAYIENLEVTSDQGNTLLIKGGSNSASSNTFAVQDLSGNNDFVINGAGNVGIGTTSPTEKLDVNGFVNALGFKVNGTTGFTGMVTIQQSPPMPPITFDIQNGIIVNVL
jgi:hypothetical protein